ncbi:MAG: hypothetical protein M8467_04610 [Anaerolineae bacterium]|nr:hypothetical protein [Anaerolineae bacterium]
MRAPTGTIKAAVCARGVEVGVPRSPGSQVSQTDQEHLHGLMVEIIRAEDEAAAAGGLAPVLGLLVAWTTPLLFILVFAALGATISGMRLGYSNFILEMAPVELRPTCVALQNTLLTPVMVLPLLVGALIEAWSYPLLLAAGAMLMAVAVTLGLRLLDPRHGAEGACLV